MVLGHPAAILFNIANNMAGGLAGLLVTSVVADAADKRGVFDFTLLEGAAAKQTLTDIHLAPPDAESR
jgi:hypothetical protein